MDTRIGYPNEHLAGESDDEVTSPQFATAVGLVMDGVRRHERKKEESAIDEADEDNENTFNSSEETKNERRSFLDKLTERVKDFLDNAE